MSRPNHSHPKQSRSASSPRSKQPPPTQTKKRLPVQLCALKINAEPSPSQRIQDLQHTVACHALHIGSQARINPHKEKRSRHLSREAIFSMLHARCLHDTSEEVRRVALSLIGQHFPQDRAIVELLFSALATNRRTARNHPIYRTLETAFSSSKAHEMHREALLQAHRLAQQPPWHTIHIDLHPTQGQQAEETLTALEQYLPSAWLSDILDDGLTAPTENTFAHAARLLGAALSRSSAWLDLDGVTQHIQQITAPLLETYALPVALSWLEQRTYQDSYLRALILLALLPIHHTAPFLSALQAILRYIPETAERSFYRHKHERIRYLAMLCLLRFPDQFDVVEDFVVQETRMIDQGTYNSRTTNNLLQIISYLPPKNPVIARWLLSHMTQTHCPFAHTSIPLLLRFPNKIISHSISVLPEHERNRLHSFLPYFFSQSTAELGSAAFRLLAYLPTYQGLDAWVALVRKAEITHAPALLHHFCHTPPAALRAIYLFERWRSDCLTSIQRDPPTHLRAHASLHQLLSLVWTHQQQQDLTPHQLHFWQRDLEDALLA